MSLRRHLLSLSLAATASLFSLAAHADVVLSFSVTNVMQNQCTGALQAQCTMSAGASFIQTLRIDDSLLGAPSDFGGGNLQYTEAVFAFPHALTPTPSSNALSALFTGPVAFAQSFAQADSFFDGDAGLGQAFALLGTDRTSDFYDADAAHHQQEYKLQYNLSTDLFLTPAFYQDMVNSSLTDFMFKYAGALSGVYDELGTSSIFNPLTLLFDSYAFTEMSGVVSLVGVERIADVPEPASLALVLLALAALAFVRARTAQR